jgi:CRISPR/Cas system CSM-associated protein Csm3 (group 7 of RAMP superfamily)
MLQSDFDVSLRNLDDYKLDPAIAGPDRETLADLFDKAMFSKWKSNCSTEIARLEVKISDVSVEIEKLVPQFDVEEPGSPFDFQSVLDAFESEKLGKICELVNSAVSNYETARGMASGPAASVEGLRHIE